MYTSEILSTKFDQITNIKNNANDNQDDNQNGTKRLYCYNCHKFSHTSKNCPETVNSYGIICFRKDDDDIIKYLVVERKYSFTYVEFIRGNYDIHDYTYIQDMFNKMTLFERCLIMNNTFKYLWAKLWGKSFKYKKSTNKIYQKGSIKFYILKNGFFSLRTQTMLKTSDFINNCVLNYKSSEWYFPKGKKNINEHPQESAIREFNEETNIPIKNIKLMNHLGQFIEQHVSSNCKTYRVYFYIARYISDIKNMNTVGRNKFQQQEIGNIDWLTYDECIQKFRKYEKEKFVLLEKVNETILNMSRKKMIPKKTK